MHARFKDLLLVDGAARKQLSALASARARALEPGLNAYALIRSECEGPAEGGLEGALRGMPYAAKDIFAAPDRRPCWGLRRQQPVNDDYADVLRLLDEAGGVRVGCAALTELALEPIGINAGCGRGSNTWISAFILV